MPSSTVSPADAASSTFGVAPMPNSTRSAGTSSPVPSTTPATRPVLARERRHRRCPCARSTPCSSCMRWNTAPSSGPIADASGTSPRTSDGDLVAVAPGGRGRLEADPSAADHDDAPVARAERGAQPRRVGQAAERVHPAESGAGPVEATRRGPGGEQQAVVAQRLARGIRPARAHGVLGGVDGAWRARRVARRRRDRGTTPRRGDRRRSRDRRRSGTPSRAADARTAAVVPRPAPRLAVEARLPKRLGGPRRVSPPPMRTTRSRDAIFQVFHRPAGFGDPRRMFRKVPADAQRMST